MEEDEYIMNTPEGVIHTIFCLFLTPGLWLSRPLIHEVFTSHGIISLVFHLIFAVWVLGMVIFADFLLVVLYYKDIKLFVTRPKRIKKWKEEQKLKSFMDKL